VVALFAALNRQGVADVCLEQSSWSILFHQRYRCTTTSGKRVSRLLNVTTHARARPGWRLELAHAVLEPTTVPDIGTIVRGSSVGEAGVMLLDDWAYAEEWGIWTNGKRASFALDASRLPARFHLEVTTRMFPPPELREQGARVLDGTGRELARISNRTPSAPLLLSIDRTLDAGNFVTVSFIIDSPVSPSALDGSPDHRELGLGLETITIRD
jgi:hypothetical protein